MTTTSYDVVRRTGAGGVGLVLGAALLLLGTTTPQATGSAPRAAQAQTIQLLSLPPIVQHGGRPAPADEARAALTATIYPVEVGRAVRLQVRQGGGWQTVSTVRQDRHGRAEFSAPVSRDGRALTYRAKATAYRDLPTAVSDTVGTERWLTPTFSDQFTGSRLSSAWQVRGKAYEPQSFRACSRGSAKAVRVGGGVLQLGVVRDPARSTLCPALRHGQVAGRYAYRLNGHVGTDDGFSFRYGVAAARIKFPRLRGQHGSFWMQPVGGMRPGYSGHEIDVVESFGPVAKRSGLWTYIHRYQDGRVVKTGTTIPNTFLEGPRDAWWRNYHVYSVQWTPKKLVFRIDGHETWRIGGRVSHAREYLILSLLSSDYELPLIKDSQLPQHMDVDWVRVWETGR